MPTLNQRKLAENMIKALESDNPPTLGTLVESSGYAVSQALSKPGFIIEQKGVQEALADYGFTEENAKRVTAEIMMSESSGPMPRLKAAEMTFKVHGSFAPEKSVGVLQVVGESTDPKADALRAEYEAKLLEQMG